MDAKKIIKKYIMPNAGIRIAGWVLLFVAVIAFLVGAATWGSDYDTDVQATEFYPNESENGTMAYIDIVGVSNWLFQYDDAVYYSAEDAEGYLYTVRLTDSQYGAMAAQQTYWNRETEDVSPPAAYHLVGYVQDVPSDVRSNLSDSWGISTAEYDQYFGTKFLNATTSVGEQGSAPWFLVALFSVLFAIVCIIISLRAKKIAKKCFRQLEERSLLEKAAQQLENTESHTVIGKNRGILTQDFLFGKGTGAVIPYSDILWAYKQEQRRNFVAVNSYLMVATLYMSAQGVIDLNRSDRKGYIGTALAVIAEKNPNVLLGYTSENGKAYRAIVKENK